MLHAIGNDSGIPIICERCETACTSFARRDFSSAYDIAAFSFDGDGGRDMHSNSAVPAVENGRVTPS